MKRVYLFSNPINRQYSAPRLSFAYFFTVVCKVATFLIPLFVCFSPRYALNLDSEGENHVHRHRNTLATPVGIWLKHDTYREQPKVSFQYKVIFVAQVMEKITVNQGEENDSNPFTPKELYFSTIGDINELRHESFRSASIKSREVDDNLDGVLDQLLLNIKMPLRVNEYVHGIKALAFINYELNSHINMDMESLVYVHHNSGLAGSKFSTYGDLSLRQRKPISRTDSHLSMYHNDNLLHPYVAGKVAMESNVGSILNKYKERDVATDYIERFPRWTSEDNSYETKDTENEDELTKKFEIDITIEIPKMQTIVYVPSLTEVLTEAWIRYLSFLIITGFCVKRFLEFVFTKNIIKASQSVE
jgi:hypothetical protein